MNRRVPFGLSLVVGGAALLLITTGTITVGSLLPPLLLIVVSIVLFWRAFRPGGREGNVFAGTFLGLSGGFWLLWESALPAAKAASVWPVFMTIGGIALVAYGCKKGREYHHTLIVPGLAIVVISFVFLFFSLDIIKASLADVVVNWWPALLVVIGLLMLAAGRRSGQREE